ncbi:MAG: hypothetical protein OXN44_09105 [Acidimicrobiaceae bacterium]|nr:hypothetical protein [Acidimicrobiaceae bacterium]
MNTITQRLEAEDFRRDPHARRYRGQLHDHPLVYKRLFELLNDPANEQRLMDAESYGKPALAGVVRFIEGDPAMATVLGSDRFRQTVGVAVRLKMAKLGWQKTGKKGTVSGARYFVKAERYTKREEAEPVYISTALAALEAVAEIGDNCEREETARFLMEALGKTRHESGRVF